MTINAPVASSARASLTTTGGGGGGFDFNTIAGLIAWYDASDAATITASGGAVSQWNNKKTGAAGATNLVQATGSLQPTTGTRTQAGKNVLDFAADTMTATLANTAQPHTIFSVLLTDSTATQTVCLSSGNNSNYLAGGVVNMYAGSVHPGPAFTTATAYVIQWDWAIGASSITVNATAGGIGSAGGGNWAGPLELGGQSGANFLDGWLADWLMYASLSSGNRATVHTELRNKWSVY